MPRSRRVIQPESPYHLISRFVAGAWLIQTSEERSMYLRLLGSAVAMSDWRCVSYAVMSSHIHLGVVAGSDPLADWIRNVHAPFAEWTNYRRARIGAVFVRGPKSLRVRSDGVAKLIGYIHRNPVRADVVVDPRDSNWTSHQAYVGKASRPAWLDVDLGLSLAGFRDPTTFDDWVRTTAVDRDDMRDVLHDQSRRPARRRV